MTVTVNYPAGCEFSALWNVLWDNQTEITFQSSCSRVNPCMAEPPDKVKQMNICEPVEHKQWNMQYTSPGRVFSSRTLLRTTMQNQMLWSLFCNFYLLPCLQPVRSFGLLFRPLCCALQSSPVPRLQQLLWCISRPIIKMATTKKTGPTLQ